jgi:hypothetical protein
MKTASEHVAPGKRQTVPQLLVRTPAITRREIENLPPIQERVRALEHAAA